LNRYALIRKVKLSHLPFWLYYGLLFFALLINFIFADTIVAKENSSSASVKRQFNLQQLEKLLLGKNSTLDALYYQLEQSLHQLKINSLQKGASLRLSYNYYPYNPYAFELSDEESISFYRQRGEIALVYPLIDIFLNRYYSRLEGESMVDEKQALLAAGQLDLLRELRIQYAAILKEKRLLDAYLKRDKQFLKWLELAKQRRYYKQSLLSEIPDIETLHLDNQSLLKQHRQTYNLKLYQLALLLGLENLEWEPAPSLTPPPAIPDRKQLTDLLEQHPLIKILSLKSARNNIWLKWRKWEPLKLDAEAGFIVEEEQDKDYQLGSRLGLRLSIPLNYKELIDYKQQSVLAEQKRWEAETKSQREKLKQQLAGAYSTLMDIDNQKELVQQQIWQAEEKITFIKTRLESSFAETESSLLPLIMAYQRLWNNREKLITLDYQRDTAYYDLLYVSGKTHFSESVNQAAQTVHNGKRPGPVSQALYAPRALYIKNSGSLANPEEQGFLLAFCHTRHINQILLNTDQLFVSTQNCSWLPKLTSLLHQQHISIWAAIGPYDGLTPHTTRLISADTTPILDYNRLKQEGETLDGLYLHFDFPGQPPEDHPRLKFELNQLLTFYQQVNRRLKAADQPLKLALTIPQWYDQLDMQLLADSIYLADELIISFPEMMQPALMPEGLKDELRLSADMERYVLLALYCSQLASDNRLPVEDYMEQVSGKLQQPVGFAIFDYQNCLTVEEK
jgi:outer membrane protein TolC